MFGIGIDMMLLTFINILTYILTIIYIKNTESNVKDISFLWIKIYPFNQIWKFIWGRHKNTNIFYWWFYTALFSYIKNSPQYWIIFHQKVYCSKMHVYLCVITATFIVSETMAMLLNIKLFQSIKCKLIIK